MAEQVLIQFRTDKELKREATAVFEAIGLDLPTAFRMFMKKSIQEGGLPFEARIPRKEPTYEEAIEALHACQEASERNGVSNMTLDEINAEIAAARAERDAFELRNAAQRVERVL